MRKPLIPALALLVSVLCLGCEALFNPYSLSGYLYLDVSYDSPKQNINVGVNFRSLNERSVSVTAFALRLKDASGDDLPYTLETPPTFNEDYWVFYREGISFTLWAHTTAADARIPTKVVVTVYFKDKLGHAASVTQSVDIPKRN